MAQSSLSTAALARALGARLGRFCRTDAEFSALAADMAAFESAMGGILHKRMDSRANNDARSSFVERRQLADGIRWAVLLEVTQHPTQTASHK